MAEDSPDDSFLLFNAQTILGINIPAMLDTNASKRVAVEPPSSALRFPPRAWRLLMSIAIIGHVIATFGPPLAFQTRGPRGVSPSVMSFLAPVQHYAEFTYLDRGYAFFAPDPGPSHLVRVDPIRNGELDVDAAVVFPDLANAWPRLRYHRYFMVSEFLHDAHHPMLPTDAAKYVGPELPAEELNLWRLTRRRYEAIKASIAHHYRLRLRCDDVQLTRIEHPLPDFVGFAESGIPLNEPRSYVVLPDDPVNLDELMRSGVNLPMPPGMETVPASKVVSPERITSSEDSMTDNRPASTRVPAQSITTPAADGADSEQGDGS